MPTTSNDDWRSGMTDFQRGEVARLESQIVSFHKRWDSLEAEERECKARCLALVAERHALREQLRLANIDQFNTEAEANDRDRDLRERLVCAALTGLCADPNLDMDMSGSRAAVAIADRTLAAMRKGGSDAK